MAKRGKTRKAALALSLPLALTFFSSRTWPQIIALCILLAACLIYGLSGWASKGSLGVAGNIGRSAVLVVFVSVVVAFYGWWFRPGWHLTGDQEEVLADAANKIPKNITILVELFENSTAGQEYGHDIMRVLKENGASVNSITVFRGVDPTPVGIVVCAPHRGDPGHEAAGFMHWRMLTANIPAKFQEDCANVDRSSFIIYVGSRPVE